MTQYINKHNLQIESTLCQLIEQKICPAVNISADDFWKNAATIFATYTPINQKLLQKRQQIQSQINQWHTDNPAPVDMPNYKNFLQQIGYLVPEGEDFQIQTTNVDSDIANIAAPQLVVPVNNARYAVNAANARWSSLFDALYSSNIIDDTDGKQHISGYNPVRGQAVVAYAFNFLDETFPLKSGLHSQVTQYQINDGELQAVLMNQQVATLANPQQLTGFNGELTNPQNILLKNNDLHIEIVLDRNHIIGKTNTAGIKDIIMEAAVTAIQDCEDSVAAVDGEEKALVYNNWFKLMQSTLTVEMQKNGKTFTRRLENNRDYLCPKTQQTFSLKGHCTLFVRHVGHLMTTPSVLDQDGNSLPEGILDALVTTLATLNDIRGNEQGYHNSSTGSMYIVKPKMHGPEEVQFTNDLFGAVEDCFNLPRYTLKVGIMDEERRTTVNLKECIRAVKHRVVFINTGFLDRTGDEIHTSMNVGAFMLKDDLKQATWLKAYEAHNVDVGLACGFYQKAQIGKGMWAMPDDMAGMMRTKSAHLKAAANTAWVPSPTAATLHAIHYHQVNVKEIQQQTMHRTPANLDDILTIPVEAKPRWSKQQIEAELNNNCQSLLGYVVRWIDSGIGCSKVKDINNIALMEDRATLRISSQHIANWLKHGIITQEQVMKSLKNMAVTVDQQNSNEADYENMAPNFDGVAFQSACDLIFKGDIICNGYTEPTLHPQRLNKKQLAR